MKTAEEIALEFASILKKVKWYRRLKYREAVELGNCFKDLYILYTIERNKNEGGEK